MTTSDQLITDVDRRRLGSLLTTSGGRAWGTLQTVGELETLLEDARALSSEEVPESLVTMNSTVKLVDLDSGARRTVTLVYPQDADDSSSAVSVTEPLGVALLGCRVGDVVQSSDESSGGSVCVAEILFQPEQAEARHL